MAAQVEEVVAGANALDAEELSPLCREALLGGRAGRDVVPSVAHEVRGGQGLAVHLAVGRERHRRQHHDGRGHHVLGQRLLQGGAQRGAVRLGTLVRHRVAHEALATGAVLTRDDDSLAHRGQLRQRGLHFAQLDAEATHLDLRVRAADEVERAVLAPAHHVAGAVQARARLAREAVRHEALGGERGAARVAARHADAAHVQLALHAQGHRLAAHVQDVGAHVGQGPADGGHASVRHALSEGGNHRGLCRAVGVEQASARSPARHHVGGQGFATGDDRAQLGQSFRRGGGQRRGREADDGEGLFAQHLLQRRARHQLLQGRQKQRGPGAQRGEDLLHRQVEGEAGELQHAAARADAVRHRFMRHQVRDAAVLHGGALGRAGASGRVEQVGQVVRGHARHRRIGALTSKRVLLGVQAERTRVVRLGEALQQHGLRQQHRSAAVLQHEGQALTGQERIHGHPGATGLEDAEQAHDDVQRALHAERDAHLGPDAPAAHRVGELVGLRVELRVGQVLSLEGGGPRVGRAARLRLEERVDAGLGEVRAGGIPVHQQPLPLLAGEEGQRGQTLARGGDDGLHESAQVARHALRGGRLEQVGAVVQRAIKAFRGSRQRQRQVELGGVVSQRSAAHRQPGHGQLRGRHVLQDEHHPEQRRLAQITHGLEPLEGDVLVGIGAQRHLTHAAQQLAHGGVAVQAGAQHQRVEEEADEPLQLDAVAAGHGRADGDVVLPGVARQQQLEGRQEEHEGREAFAVAEGLHGLGQCARQHDGSQGARRRGVVVAWSVGGQLQVLRRAVELAPPPGELLLQLRPVQPLPLPGGVVRVLERERRQDEGHTRGERGVGDTELPHQDAHGPAVRHDVVDVEQQHV